VCLLPGTELSFAYEVRRSRLWPWNKNIIHHKTAIFRQVNLDCPHAHHDALEFPDGEIVLLTYLMEGQQATVLQLPAVWRDVQSLGRSPNARLRIFDHITIHEYNNVVAVAVINPSEGLFGPRPI
jgi:hypothetical protein